MPLKSAVKPPSETIKTLENNAREVRDGALALNARIERFQQILGAIRGRTQTWYFGISPTTTHDNEEPFALALHFSRVKDKWCISYADIPASDAPTDNYNTSPLIDAPIEIKLAAIRQFPDLLAAIERSQKELLSRMRETVQAYDAFETLLPSLPKMEGK